MPTRHRRVRHVLLGQVNVTSTVRQHTARWCTFVPVICCDDLYFESFIQADSASASSLSRVGATTRGRTGSRQVRRLGGPEGRLRETLNIFAELGGTSSSRACS